MSTDDDPAHDFEAEVITHLHNSDQHIMSLQGKLYGAWLHLENTHLLHFVDKLVSSDLLSESQNKFEEAMRNIETGNREQRSWMQSVIQAASAKFQLKHQGLKNEIVRLRAQLQNIQGDPEQLGEEPILPPFTPNSMPAGQSVINDYSPFRPVVRSPVAQPLVLELDMDSEDISDDTTGPGSDETHLYEYDTDQDF